MSDLSIGRHLDIASLQSLAHRAEPANDNAGAKNPCNTATTCEPSKNVTAFATGKGDGNAVALNDVKQGGLNDCFLMAALGSVAKNNPDAIKNMVKDNGDGTYTVTFKEHSNGFFGIGGGDKEVKVTVNADLPQGGRHANATGDADAKGKQEIWPAIIEKAYAQYKGGYDKIDSGGSAGDAMKAITGKSVENKANKDYSADDLKADLQAGKAVTFATPKGAENLPKDSAGNPKYGLHDWHAYVVKGVTEENGKTMVELYNPWGSDHPTRIPYDEAQKIFAGATIGDTK